VQQVFCGVVVAGAGVAVAVAEQSASAPASPHAQPMSKLSSPTGLQLAICVDMPGTVFANTALQTQPCSRAEDSARQGALAEDIN